MPAQNENSTTEFGVLPEIEYESLEFYERLSAGTYGAVYRAKWNPSGHIVAVKRLLVLEKEAHVLSLIRHRNIVQFYGAVTKPPNFCIVTEFASKGSLYHLLHDKDNFQLTFDVIIQWALDIASGIHYLHFDAPVTIIHRDLKSKNVVIDAKDVCKLCDFGTSRTLFHTTKMSYVGTMPWMSPEMIQSLPVSESTDTWSYGVILWELMTREVPFAKLDDIRIMWMVVQNGLRLTIPKSCPAQFAQLMKRCWETESRSRPNFKEILHALMEIRQDNATSMETKNFLGRVSEWKSEIERETDRLKAKELDITDKLAKLKEWEQRLSKREQNLEYSRRLDLPSYDVNVWTEEDVVTWVLKLNFQGVAYEQLAELATTFRNQQIIGERLLLMTDTDLANMGVTSPAFRWQILREITRLGYDNKRLLNFPPLTAQHESILNRMTSEDSPRRNLNEITSDPLELTLLFSIYLRLSAGMDSHKWKLLMDVDDDYFQLSHHPTITEFHQLISHVCFMVTKPPYVFKVVGFPFIMREWLIGLNGPQRVKCVVYFADSVRQPRNTTVTFDMDYEKRGVVIDKRVQLYLRGSVLIRSSVDVTSGLRTGSPSPSPRNSSALLHDSQSSPALARAWKDRTFHDAVPVLSPPPTQMKKSPLWTQIVVGLLTPPCPANWNVSRSGAAGTSPRLQLPPRTRAYSHVPSDHGQMVQAERTGNIQSYRGSYVNPSPVRTQSVSSANIGMEGRAESVGSTGSGPPARRGGRVRYQRRPVRGSTGSTSSSTISDFTVSQSVSGNDASMMKENGAEDEDDTESKMDAPGSSVTSVQVHGGNEKWKWKQ